ncbi:MAG: hypothetical protein DRI36_02610 [Caldiserica bacterium]|nr:MAG: hypothetical protein DRI36_02610 [Caldisericota bacterium]
MAEPVLKTLAEEKVVVIKSFPFPIKGIIRLVDKKGRTLGIILDKRTLDEIEEDIEATSPEFLNFLQKSRKSGRVSGKSVKRKAGLK